MSHTVLLDVKCKKGAGVQLLEVMLPALADTRAYKGCELVETYVDSDDPDHIILWEKWEERGNHEMYMNWRVETGMLDAIGEFLAGPPMLVHLAAID